jgi:hypothetical protein
LPEGGGNNPAPAVPLVALGTQNGTIEVVNVMANAVSGYGIIGSNSLPLQLCRRVGSDGMVII